MVNETAGYRPVEKFHPIQNSINIHSEVGTTVRCNENRFEPLKRLVLRAPTICSFVSAPSSFFCLLWLIGGRTSPC